MRSMVVVATFLLAGWGAVAQAAIQSLDFTIHEEYISTRALGMGNAFTAAADDFSALFYNPALLAMRTDGQLRMFVRGSTDASVFKLKNEIKDANNATDKTKAYEDLLVSHYGDHFYSRSPTIGAVWVRPNWGIAFIPADLSIDLDVHRQMGPMLNVNIYQDSTVAFGYAHKLHWLPKGHDLSWGVTAKGIYRAYVGEALSAGELADGKSPFSTKDANEGLTGDLDLGTYWAPPAPQHGFFKFLKYMKPSFALVGRNLIDYGFKQNLHLISKDSGEPPPLQRRLDFGTKWDLPKFWVFDPHLTADIRDVGHHNWSMKKGTHVGAELYWKMYNWWRGHWAFGYNQGYWTAGFGARMAWFQLDLATYGEEVGTDDLPKEDRRYIVECALEF